MKLSQTRQAIVEELVKIAVNWGADEYMSDGLRTLESDLSQALNDYTEEIVRMVEDRLYSGKGRETGVWHYEQNEANEMEASWHGDYLSIKEVRQALNDIKEALNDTK